MTGLTLNLWTETDKRRARNAQETARLPAGWAMFGPDLTCLVSANRQGDFCGFNGELLIAFKSMGCRGREHMCPEVKNARFPRLFANEAQNQRIGNLYQSIVRAEIAMAGLVKAVRS